MGVFPIIIVKKDFSSLLSISLEPRAIIKLVKWFTQIVFIPYSIKIKYGDCSTLVVRVVVVRKKRVRSSPFTLMGFFFRKKETTVVEKTMNGKLENFQIKEVLV